MIVLLYCSTLWLTSTGLWFVVSAKWIKATRRRGGRVSNQENGVDEFGASKLTAVAGVIQLRLSLNGAFAHVPMCTLTLSLYNED